MTTLKELNRYGADLEKILLLRTAPIAVKMLEKEEDIPEGAIRPKRDQGVHLAQCQAFAMSRRKRLSVAMLKEDNWCWAPLIGYGLKELPEDYSAIPFMIENPKAAKKHAENFPRLEHGKYIGILSAPLRTANFDPDLILIYSNTAQLRSMLMAVKYKQGSLVTSLFDPIDSCIYSTVPTLLTGQYRITLPDPGEYERAMAGEDEIIFSVPMYKIPELISGLNHFEERKMGYTHLTMDMRPDFPRPPFYKKLYELWGLDVEE
jgi:uncharacterized protein (DUF169 family)